MNFMKSSFTWCCKCFLMILFFRLNVVTDENSDFAFCCQTAFTSTNTKFSSSISFFKSEISDEHVLRKRAQTLRDLTSIVDCWDFKKLTFRTFFTVFARLCSSHKLRNNSFLKWLTVFYYNWFWSFIWILLICRKIINDEQESLLNWSL